MYSFLLLYYTYFVIIKLCDASGEAHYECGPHGRFEYCIDGIPGCVVGCHCHPGYYFDTETKICEPNIKLAQDYRRHFYLEPTRMPLANTLEPVSPPTPSTKSPVDEKVDAIAQDADDLGDWLYNQFFKTIENQVINKTDSETLTRRSGSSPIQPARPIPKRRSRKRQKKSSRRKKSGKKRFNKKGLKRKLLRITEDDSLFDSTSDETDDDSSTDLSSSESFSDYSFDTDDQSDDKGHGHRKILMINKKPTPPLPSFIFLPNIQTPFYPPIGLPPPPVMPMYPMVPVPPVGPMLVIKEKSETEVPSNKTSTTEPPTTQATGSTDTTTVAALTTTANSTKLRAWDSFDENSKALRQNNERQNKMMRLRNRMKKKNKKLSTQPLDFPDAESPYLNDGESPMPMKFRSQPMYDSIPPLDDVDFKYLSQLIHKVDLNKTKPNFPLKPNHGMEGVPPNLDPVIISRRNYQAQIHSSATLPESDLQYHRSGRPASKADDMSEAFYSNLGKQIAALIRKKVDGDVPSQFDINIEQQGQKSPMHAIFNENRFAPRSYWERFARSPLKPPRTYEDNMINIKHSSENLLNLEDQVNVATAIERILSLQELENIANTMVKRRGQGSKKNSRILKLTRNPSPILSKTFGISLLPPDMRRKGSAIRAVKNNNPEYNTKNILKKKNERKLLPNNFYVQPRKQAIYRNQNITKQNSVIIAKNVTHSFLSKLFKSPKKSPLHNQVSRIVQRNITAPKVNPAQRIVKYQLNPMMVNYKSINYIGNNRKQYHSQQSMIPFPLFSQHSAIKPTRVNPHHSYFRHEYHHFDYFD